MNILALIPARGNSKRLHRKNIKILGGKPLINWTIDLVKNVPEVSAILVSTDDNEIAEISKAAGALVPWLRPSELSSDTATSADVVLHALNWYEGNVGVVDGILLLQPTSPFRTQRYIKEGISIFKKNMNSAVIGVTHTHTHPMWTMKINNSNLEPFIIGDGVDKRFQDLTAAYVINGSFYLISALNFHKHGSFFNSTMKPLINNSSYESLDIDTAEDFEMAEYFISKR